MVILPLDKKLKKKIHREIALAQDMLVREIYNKFPKAVIHGGTAIWRCYSGSRFSEDVDVYLPLSAKKTVKDFPEFLRKKGFLVEKFKATENSVFAKFSYLGAVVSFEAVFWGKKPVIKHFEMSDGTFMLVNTLSPEDIIKEKVSAYLVRKKIRDLYDIFFLLGFVENMDEIGADLKRLVKGFQKPVDEKDLKTLIITGSVPNVENMMEMVRKWAK